MIDHLHGTQGSAVRVRLALYKGVIIFMKKIKILNLLVSLFSIYLPLVFFSSYDYLFINIKKRKVDNFEENKRLKDLPKKVESLKKGLMPVFYPENILILNDFKSIYPIGSLPLTNSYYCDEGYGLVKYKTDRFGLRNSDKKWNDNRKSKIFLIGDSYTHGACVDDQSTMSSYIEKSLNQNTFNLATGGNGAYEYRAIIRNIIDPIVKNSNSQNTVIVIFYGNDNVRFNSKKENLIENTLPIVEFSDSGEIQPNKFYKENIENIIYSIFPENTKKYIDIIQRNRLKTFKRSPLYYIGTLVPVRTKFQYLKLNISKEENPTVKLIIDLDRICKDRCKPVISYIPNSNYWKSNNVYDKYRLILRDLAKSYNMQFIDGSEVIDQNNLNDYAPEGGHLSKEGYKKMANHISNSIQ